MVLIHRQNAIRKFIDGEIHVKRFLLAYLGLMQGYILLPGYESSKSYADLYVTLSLVHQPDMVHSYIVEVKYTRRDTSDTDVALLKRDAVGQLRYYTDGGKVVRTKRNTRLGLITSMFKGWESVVLEKLASRADCESASEA